MKKRFTKVISAALLLAMALSGCGTKNDGNKKALTGGDGDYLISKEPIEVTVFYNRENKIDGTPIWNKIAELTNIHVKTTNAYASDASSALATMYMSGEMPDLYIAYHAQTEGNKYGPDGAWTAIDEYISDETPYLKELFERDEVKKMTTASDGHKYYVPGTNTGVVSKGWLIRQDWLDKLGLKAPTSVEEFYNVLVAFRDQDPNGNGKKDEVPYISRFSQVTELMYLFDAYRGWTFDKDGKVCFGPLLPEFKTAYEHISKWYGENLIDKEIYTRGMKAREKMFGDNLSGVVCDWFSTTCQYNDLYAETIPGFNMKGIAPPSGKVNEHREPVTPHGICIGGNSKYKEELVKLADFMYSPIGETLMNYGVEGETYDMVDGKPKYKDSVLNGDKPVTNQMSDMGTSSFPYANNYEAERQWMNATAVEGADMYLNNDYIGKMFPYLQYTPEEEKEYKKIMTDVNTYSDEMTQKWVFGTVSIADTYDEFISELKRLGVERATEIQQAAYNRYQEIK